MVESLINCFSDGIGENSGEVEKTNLVNVGISRIMG